MYGARPLDSSGGRIDVSLCPLTSKKVQLFATDRRLAPLNGVLLTLLCRLGCGFSVRGLGGVVYSVRAQYAPAFLAARIDRAKMFPALHFPNRGHHPVFFNRVIGCFV